MKKSSPQELKRLKAMERELEIEKSDEKKSEKRLGTHEDARQRKLKIWVTWFIAFAFIVTSVGLLMGFGMDSIDKDAQQASEEAQKRPLTEAERAQKEQQANIKYFQEQIEKEPNNAQLYNNLASAYFESGNNKDALDCYKKALEIAPGDTYAKKSMAQVYMSEKKFDEARKILNEVLGKEEPLNKPVVYKMLAQTEVGKKNYDGAIQQINEALKINAGDTESYIMLTQLYMVKKDKKSARETIKKGMEVAKTMNDEKGQMILSLYEKQIDKPAEKPKEKKEENPVDNGLLKKDGNNEAPAGGDDKNSEKAEGVKDSGADTSNSANETAPADNAEKGQPGATVPVEGAKPEKAN